MSERIPHVCNGCGACCRQLPGECCTVIIFPSELERVAAAAGKSPARFVREDCLWDELELSGQTIPVLCLRFSGDSCGFLDEHLRCRIYESRPYQCRMFDEGYFSEDILNARAIPCVEGREALYLTDEGNEREYALAMELLLGYPPQLLAQSGL